MKFKFNKKCFLSVLSSTISIPIIATTAACSCSLFPHKDPYSLTSDIVLENFKTIWKNKKHLDASDLESYKYIYSNAFDDLKFELDYVDLSNIELYNINRSIHWPKVKELRISNNTNDKKIINNILFVKDMQMNEWYANSIANRTIKMETLKFPSTYELTNSPSKYLISNYFYDNNIFKNIDLIIFNYENEETPIKNFGTSSFENCTKLTPNLFINYNEEIDTNKFPNSYNVSNSAYCHFQDKSFYNTNINIVNISLSNPIISEDQSFNFFIDKSIHFTWDSFSNNKNLVKFELINKDFNNPMVDIQNSFNNCPNLEVFKIKTDLLRFYEPDEFLNCKKLRNIEIIVNKLETYDPNIFANKYDSLNLTLLIDEWENNKLDKNTFSGIELDTNKLNVKTYNKESLKNKGWTQNQFNKIEEIPYTSEVLNKKIVNQNFNTIWKDKKILTTNDLSNYQYIKHDAFDDLTFELDYVDISNLEIIANSFSIKWKNVKEIKSINNNKHKVVNNILFLKYRDYWWANTLANRNIEIENLVFPKSTEIESQNQNKYAISDYFYNVEIFNNVHKISFNNVNEESSVAIFGKSSFENCNILDENLNLNYHSKSNKNLTHQNIVFRSLSFYNTNISSVDIKLTSDSLNRKIMLFGYKVFSNNKNLINFNINEDNLSDNTFIDTNIALLTNCEKLESFNLNAGQIQLAHYLFLDSNNLNKIYINTNNIYNFWSNVFTNEYKSLDLKLFFKKANFYIDNQDIDNQFIGIDVDINNLNIEMFYNPDISYSGLTKEQLNKIKFKNMDKF